MIPSTSHQAWLFYAPLARQAVLLKDDLLDPVDALLDDPALVDLVRQGLAARSPLSTRTGRDSSGPGSSAARCCVMKHLKGWSFPRSGTGAAQQPGVPPLHPLRCRGYARFHDLQPQLCPAQSGGHGRDSSASGRPRLRARRNPRGDRLRTDTTVVESNIHNPTDSSLLGDGIRVLSRSLQRIAVACTDGALEVIDHGRAVKHRLLEISRAAKCLTQANQQRMRDSYQKLVGLTRSVVRQASEVVQRWGKGRAEGGRANYCA